MKRGEQPKGVAEEKVPRQLLAPFRSIEQAPAEAQPGHLRTEEKEMN